ncbi:MAG: S8 family serine peptidase [Caldilineales bacterium]|nr:S8 family serine peptidase [Caldilineales bacterium]
MTGLSQRLYILLCGLLLLAGLWQAVVSNTVAAPGVTDAVYWQTQLQHPHAPGEIMVRYRDDQIQALGITRPDALSSALLVDEIAELDMVVYRSDDDLATTLAAVNADPSVEFAEPNYYLFPDYEPDDPYYLNYAANDSLSVGGYLNRMNMVAAWDTARGRKEIVVAVIDSGVDLDHEDMAGAIWQNPGEIPGNGVDDDQNGLIDDIIGWNFAANSANVDDWHGHGSHVSGIIAARFNNGIGIAGIAPKVQIMPIGVFASINGQALGTFADEVKSLLYATDMGARVINLSLGSNAYSRGEQMAVEYAVSHGVVVVAAAGNDGRDAYHWPAAHEAAIAVGATTAKDGYASFSNRGAFLDISAPGVSIWSLSPSGSYRPLSGTSMASPHVAGVAALILSINPTLSPAQVRQILESTAADLGAVGWDNAFGHGRVDAFAAVQATAPSDDPVSPPDWLPSVIWPETCVELIQDGDFEAADSSSWALSGSASLTNTLAATGEQSLFLTDQPGAEAAASQVVTIPPDVYTITMSFALWADSADTGWGTDPMNPGRDHLSAWLQTPQGDPLISLLHASNIGASASWDQALHVLSPSELDLLKQTGSVELWFQAQNAIDTLPTRFQIDSVRLCASRPPVFLPRLIN